MTDVPKGVLNDVLNNKKISWNFELNHEFKGVNCVFKNLGRDNIKMDCKELAIDFRDDPNMSLGNVRQKLQDRYGLTGLPKCKLFRARLKAKGGTVVARTEEFINLRCYGNMVLIANLGNKAIIRSDVIAHPPHFKRLFICLQASIPGFVAGCRPVIGLDGCHLKLPYGGILLAAIGMEANLQFLFPLHMQLWK